MHVSGQHMRSVSPFDLFGGLEPLEAAHACNDAVQLHCALVAGLGAKNVMSITNRFPPFQLRGALVVEPRHFEHEETPVAPITFIISSFF